MSDTLLRQWELLRAIPRAPRKIDVAALMAKLEANKAMDKDAEAELNAAVTEFKKSFS